MCCFCRIAVRITGSAHGAAVTNSTPPAYAAVDAGRELRHGSIGSSDRSVNACGIVRPCDRAVERLIANSSVDRHVTGSAPARMFHTADGFGSLVPNRALPWDAAGLGARFLVDGSTLDGLPPTLTPPCQSINGDVMWTST